MNKKWKKLVWEEFVCDKLQLSLWVIDLHEKLILWRIGKSLDTVFGRVVSSHSICSRKYHPPPVLKI
jgi:hypothetical protein